MIRRMTKHLTARLTTGLAVAALAVSTALPTPAAAMDAKDRRLLTLLLGAAAVGVLINETNKKKSTPQVTRQYQYDDGYDYGYGHDRDPYGRHRDNDRWRYRTVPAECVFSLRGTHGPRDVVSSRCLSEFGMHRDLPAECGFQVDAGWGSRTVYGTRCLRENGYRIASTR